MTTTRLATPRTPVLLTPPSHGVERVAWDELGPEFIRTWGYPRGVFEPEHLTVYGKTRSGKTYFITYILRLRAAVRGSPVVVVATKKTDATLLATGWKVHDSYPFPYGQPQGIFWAKSKGLSAEHRLEQRNKVRKLLDDIWVPHSNTIVYFDELPYIENMLGLKPQVETFYREGAGNGITCVSGMQRPARVSREAHSETAWTVAFPTKDADDRTRVAEVFGDRKRFVLVLADLDRRKREFVIKSELTGETYISHLPGPRADRPVGRPAGRSARGRAGVRSDH